MIGGATLFAAVAAAKFARDAAHETKRSADAAETAIKEAQRIGEAQTRCYITVVGAQFKLHGRVPIIQVQIKNSGQSPARELKVSYGFEADVGAAFLFSGLEMHPAITEGPQDVPAHDCVWAPVWHPRDPIANDVAEAWKGTGTSVTMLAVNIIGKDVFGMNVAATGYFTAHAANLGGSEFRPMIDFASSKADALAQVMQYKLDGVLA